MYTQREWRVRWYIAGNDDDDDAEDEEEDEMLKFDLPLDKVALKNIRRGQHYHPSNSFDI